MELLYLGIKERLLREYLGTGVMVTQEMRGFLLLTHTETHLRTALP
jgi:hypothetical protein